jgi:hypothetical protein
MPQNISSIIQSEVPIAYYSMGATATSRGEIVLVEYSGNHIEVFSYDLVHLRFLNVAGALQFIDITSKSDVLFLTDHGVNSIFVVMESESCSHRISLTWRPTCVAVYEYTLFVTNALTDVLYKIQLDGSYRQVGAEQVFLTSPHFDEPSFVHASSSQIAVATFANSKLVVSRSDGSLDWTYGQLLNPRGVDTDKWGRFVIADGGNKRVVLVSPDGQFVRYLVTGLDQGIVGVAVLGNMVYVVQRAPSQKLIRFEIL